MVIFSAPCQHITELMRHTFIYPNIMLLFFLFLFCSPLRLSRRKLQSPEGASLVPSRGAMLRRASRRP